MFFYRKIKNIKKRFFSTMVSEVGTREQMCVEHVFERW